MDLLTTSIFDPQWGLDVLQYHLSYSYLCLRHYSSKRSLPVQIFIFVHFSKLFMKGHVYKYHMEIDNIKSGNSATTGLVIKC